MPFPFKNEVPSGVGLVVTRTGFAYQTGLEIVSDRYTGSGQKVREFRIPFRRGNLQLANGILDVTDSHLLIDAGTELQVWSIDPINGSLFKRTSVATDSSYFDLGGGNCSVGPALLSNSGRWLVYGITCARKEKKHPVCDKPRNHFVAVFDIESEKSVGCVSDPNWSSDESVAISPAGDAIVVFEGTVLSIYRIEPR